MHGVLLQVPTAAPRTHEERKEQVKESAEP